MRAFIFVTASVALFLAVSASPVQKDDADITDDAGNRFNRAANDDDDIPHLDFFEVTGQCFPGEYFYDKCNVCYCDPSGAGASCTLVECSEPEYPHIDGYKQGMKCPAGKPFHNDCNTCVCGDDGVSAGCTFMQCPGKA